MVKLIRIKGTDPASSVRLVLNSNLEILESAINKIDSIINLSSGNMNNSVINGNQIGEIRTGNLITSGNIGISITNGGNLNIKNGKLILESNESEIDLNNGVKISKVNLETSTNPYHYLKINSMVQLKSMTSLELSDLINPIEGTISFNTTTKKLVLFDGTNWINLN